jgi:hypothetical protein
MYYIRDSDCGVYHDCFLLGCVTVQSDKIYTEWRKGPLTLEPAC